MKHNYLYDALPFLKDVEKERQEQFKEYFAGPSKETDWGEVPGWNCDDEIEQ